MRCDNLVCLLTMAGLVIVFIYHAYAIDRLVDFCSHNPEDECKKELLHERYDEIGVWYWHSIVVILNILSVIAFCFSQYFMNKWLRLFKE